MATNKSSSAFEQLARLSGQFQTSETIVYDWLKVIRALKHVKEDLYSANMLDMDTENELNSLMIRVADLRSAQCDQSRRVGERMDNLNSLIQNGAYDHE